MTESKGKYNVKGLRAKAEAANTDAAPKDDPIVTFTMNARKSHRRWWAGQAKLQGKTMTEIATAALVAEFGLPPES